jgi:hypothetical protein
MYFTDFSVTATDWEYDCEILPNPGSGSFTVRFTDPSLSETSIRVYDITGILVYQRKFPPGERITLRLDDLAEGIYAICIQIENVIIPNRIIKIN